MPAKSKRARKTRVSREFDLAALTVGLQPPKSTSGAFGWTFEQIKAARDDHMRGSFKRSSDLIDASRRDAAIFAAQVNRIAPSRGLTVALKPPVDTARARRIAEEAEALFGSRGIGLTKDTISSIHDTLAWAGLAVGRNRTTPRADGSRVDFEHVYWPLEHVRWDQTKQCLVTRVEGAMGEEEIRHGDGGWVVYQNLAHQPWKHGAVVPAALTWGSRALGVHDLTRGSNKHAGAKVVGTMPENVPIQSAPGVLSAEASEFLDLLKTIASAETPYGIKPFGSAIDYLVNTSNAWQVFDSVIKLGDRDAGRIWLGSDGMASDAGGNYIKSKYLFGVRNDIVEADLKGSLEPSFLTGIIEPWAAINFGDSSLAPVREFLMPDADEDARRDGLATRTKAFNEAIAALRANGFVVDQQLVADLAKDFGVPAARLADTTPSGSDFYAYEIEGGIVTIDEVRERKGLQPLPGGAGAMTVPQARALAEAGATASPTPSGTGAPSPAPRSPGPLPVQ